MSLPWKLLVVAVLLFNAVLISAVLRLGGWLYALTPTRVAWEQSGGYRQFVESLALYGSLIFGLWVLGSIVAFVAAKVGQAPAGSGPAR